MRQPQPKKPFKDEDEERNAIQLQHDISEHEAAIMRLQKVLKSKDEVVCPFAVYMYTEPFWVSTQQIDI